MYTYRWQRRLIGALVCGLLFVFNVMLFETYSTKIASYVTYGILSFTFGISFICLLVSGFWYAFTNFKLGKKSLF